MGRRWKPFRVFRAKGSLGDGQRRIRADLNVRGYLQWSKSESGITSRLVHTESNNVHIEQRQKSKKIHFRFHLV